MHQGLSSLSTAVCRYLFSEFLQGECISLPKCRQADGSITVQNRCSLTFSFCRDTKRDIIKTFWEREKERRFLETDKYPHEVHDMNSVKSRKKGGAGRSWCPQKQTTTEKTMNKKYIRGTQMRSTCRSVSRWCHADCPSYYHHSYTHTHAI